MDFSPKPTCSTPELTPEIARGIFELIRTYGNVSTAFKSQNQYDYSHFGRVHDELVRMTNAITLYMQGQAIRSAAVLDEETGIETVPATYHVPDTKTKLVNWLTSDYLNSLDVLNLVMHGQTWASYKASFTGV